MVISIVTLFPDMFTGPFDHSIIKRAVQDKKITIDYISIRDFGIGRHQEVDDRPYGGGVGMVMRVDVLHQAIEKAKENHKDLTHTVILLDPRGETFVQQKAKGLSTHEHLIFICGHYEGYDERIRGYVDQTISIGNFVTTGGEIPTMLIVDAIARLVPGVLKEDATDIESFAIQGGGEQLVEFPQYTNPREYEGESVPEVLVSGNHQEIARWREQEAKKLTQTHRPDLLKK